MEVGVEDGEWKGKVRDWERMEEMEVDRDSRGGGSWIEEDGYKDEESGEEGGWRGVKEGLGGADRCWKK